MTIKLIGKYKSLNSFESDELKTFSVITGKNGSGKSQLLNLIQTAHKKQQPEFQLNLLPEPENIQYEGLPFGKVELLQGQALSSQLTQIYMTFSQIAQPVKDFIIELMQNGLNLNEITKTVDYYPFMNEKTENEKDTRVQDICRRFLGGNEVAATLPERIKKNRQKISGNLFSWKKSLITANEVSKYKKKNFQDVTKNDLYSTPLNETDYTNDNSFGVEIANLFYGYARKRFINEIEYNRKLNGASNDSVSPEDFEKSFSPPWVEINKILAKHKFKLKVMEIRVNEFSPEFDLDFHLINTETNDKIKLDELSSGEKIVVGLIIRLFLTQAYKDNLQFPDFMVFDEPDAFLHPEISFLIIEVLEQTFTKEFGIQVLITTHNPSTIAMSPDDCIYELKNGINTSLKNVSKDYALNILTESLPLLSINYGNHRQVFVESPTDQYYYQAVFNKLKGDKKTLFDLYFITTGYGKSNCAEVIKLTNELRGAGNKTSYGIIDWDNINNPTAHILVNGYKKRYSIENFILDPLHLCILFIEQKCANNISDIGFDLSYNQYSLAEEDEKRLQEVSDWFFGKIEKEFPLYKLENLREIDYSNGKKIQIPEWYLVNKGHDIEIKLKIVFPSLNSFRNEGDLQKRLTEIASKCYPFLPTEPIEIIKTLSNK